MLCFSAAHLADHIRFNDVVPVLWPVVFPCGFHSHKQVEVPISKDMLYISVVLWVSFPGYTGTSGSFRTAT